MAFKTNSSKASEGGNLKPEGYYETLIESAKIEDFTKADGTVTQRIKLKYVIRNDVEQKYKNACLFNDIWKKKEPNEDDISIDGFNFGQLMAVSDAVKLPDNKEYESVSALLAELVGKPVKVHLYHNFYNGKKYEKIDEHKPTDFPNAAHKAKAASHANTYAVPPAQSFAGGFAQTSALHSEQQSNCCAKPCAAAAADVSDDDDYPF